MSIDPKEAAASLNEVAEIERRTHQAMTYQNSSAQFILWGVLVACGYLFTFFQPSHADTGWITVAVLGVGGSFALRAWSRLPHSRDSQLGRRLGYAQLALIGYGLILLWLLSPLSHRQMSAFWPSLVMFCHVLAGIWLGRVFILIGGAVTALVVVGYVSAGDWYPLWLAAAVGGGLVVSGVWLRRMG